MIDHSDFKKRLQIATKMLSKYSKKEKIYSKNKNLRFDGLMFLWKTLQNQKVCYILYKKKSLQCATSDKP